MNMCRGTFLLVTFVTYERVFAEDLLVCVTGGTGFIAGHISKKLREEGYRVRATVRKKSADDQYLMDMGVEIVEGADILVPGSFDAALIGCDYVHHCAMPFKFDYAHGANAHDGMMNVLEAAKKGGTVRRLVFISSLATVTWGDPATHPEGENHVWTEDDWQQGLTFDKGPHGFAKRQAEETAWRFMEEFHSCFDEEKMNKTWLKAHNKPCFDMAVLNPAFVLGPLLNKQTSSQSIMFLKSLLDGSRKKAEHGGVGLVDVRDVADASVRAMTAALTAESGALNKHKQARFILATKRTYSCLEIALLLKRAGFAGQFAIPSEAEGPKMPKLLFNPDRARTVLGVQYRDIYDTVYDTVDSMIAKGIVTPKKKQEL